MKTHIVSFFVGLMVLLFVSGCCNSSATDRSKRVTFNPNGTLKENTEMNIEQHSQEAWNPLKGVIQAVVVISANGGYGGGYQENCNEGYSAQNASYWGGGYGGRGRINPGYQQHRQQPRPYVQNTGDGRLHQRQEQPCYRDAYCDEYGTFHPAGFYYANGNFYPVH